MKWWNRGILIVVFAAMTALASAIVPAFVLKSLLVAGPSYQGPRMFWCVEDGQMVLWEVDPSHPGCRIVNVIGTGVSTFPDTTEEMMRSVPGWVVLPRGADRGYSWTGEGYGWPCVMLSLHENYEYGRLGLTEESDRWTSRAFGLDVILPTLVHWPGAILNFIAACALWACLLAIPQNVRRFVRRRRGQCLKCGYDLRATATGICPECGGPA